jgi:hypothetical protein
MAKPPTVGCLAPLFLALFIALTAAGYQGTYHLVVLPQCRAACAEAHQRFEWLYAGQRGPTRPAACVCSEDVRIETSGPDLMMLVAALLGFGGLWAAARLLAVGEAPPGRAGRGR